MRALLASVTRSRPFEKPAAGALSTIGRMSVDVQSLTYSASQTAVDHHVVGSADRELVANDPQAALRSDPRERRGWLRFLDQVLADEIRWAGALSYEELLMLANRPLANKASAETIREWWEYSRRRGWLAAQEDDRFQLTDAGRVDLQERHDRLWQPNPFEGAKAITKAILPGVFGLAGYAAGKSDVAALVILLGFCLALVVGLIIGGTVMRWIDRPLDRWAARRACNWLDGRPVRLSRKFRTPVPGQVVRLYELSPSP